MSDSDDPRDREPDDEPMPPHRGRDRELWVGVFFLVGLIAVVAALFILTDAALFRGRYIVTTNVPYAGGIRKGDPVQMRGVNVGRILRFNITQSGVRISLEVEGEYEIPRDSHVMLRSSGLLGGMVADVVPGEAREVLHGGDVLPGEVEPAMMDTATRISAQAETVLGRMEALLSQATIKNVEASSGELRDLLGNVNGLATEQRRELRELTRSLKETSTRFQDVATNVGDLSKRPELDRALVRLDTVTARLDAVTTSLERTSKSAESFLGGLERGEGTLGKLSKDPALYNNMNEAATNLSRLAEDVRKQPKRYLDMSIF